MGTIFRFAIQTRDRRLSEVWSFFANQGEGCLYATRTSMTKWLKISFHQSGMSHIKTYDSESRLHGGTRGASWTYPTVSNDGPVHVLRVIYDISRQTASFPLSERVKIVFEEWKGRGSVNLDAFFAESEDEIVADEDSGIVAAHRLNGRRWVYFTITVGPPQDTLPEPISGMTFHFGEPEVKPDSNGTTLLNSTAMWYSVPKSSGTLTVVEGSFARFTLNDASV